MNAKLAELAAKGLSRTQQPEEDDVEAEEDDEDDDEHQESHTGLLLTEFGTGSEPVIPEEVETSATDDSIGEEEAANTTANTIINTSTSTTPVL